jgi:hypothetical protein
VSGVQFPPWPPKTSLFFLYLRVDLFLAAWYPPREFMGFSTHLLEIHLTVALRCFLKTGSVRLRSSKLRMLYPLVPKQFASTDRRHKLPATSRNYSQVPNEIMSSNARERELGRIAKRLAELAAERQALESARAALVGAVAEQSPARSIFTQQAAPQDKNSSSENETRQS